MISFGWYEEQTLWLGVKGQSLVFFFFQDINMAPKNFNMSRLSEEKWPWHGWLWIIIKSASFLSILLNAFLSPLSQLHSGKKQAEQPRQLQLCVRQPSEDIYIPWKPPSWLFFFALCRQSDLVSRISDTGINWKNQLRPELIVKEVTQGQSLLG